jgi:uncharacterized protein (DUF1697 family)
VKHVVFVRAINVAGHPRARMHDVRETFVAAGARDVSTCLQSGNILFEASTREAVAILRRARTELRRLFREDAYLAVRTAAEIEALVAQAPFSAIEAGPRVKLYVAFLMDDVRIAPTFPLVDPVDRLEAVAMRGREVFLVSRPKPNGFFGFPNNFVERVLGVSATTRNWSTIGKIVALLSPSPSAVPSASRSVARSAARR